MAEEGNWRGMIEWIILKFFEHDFSGLAKDTDVN